MNMEKKIYAIHGGESIFAVVQAKDKDEAFNIFARNQAEDDESLIQEVTEFSTGSALFGSFYRDNKGAFIDEMTGDDVPRIKK